MDITTENKLFDAVTTLLKTQPTIARIVGIEISNCKTFGALVGVLLGRIAGGNAEITTVSERVFSENPDLRRTALRDILETARRNFEPGGPAATLLFSRGSHATLAHRVAHRLWSDGDTDAALAVKSTLGRALSTDIHPAARIGAGFWLDHGLGFVVGETTVIAEDVSIWHNVTLGSTLTHSGPTRHPRIERGAVIGAGAHILGNITIGAGAVIAAGAIVVEDVPPNRVMLGRKARLGGAANVFFTLEYKGSDK